jgi:hypothetical protein
MPTSREKVQVATKPITHWLAHYAPTSVIAIDADGEEHEIAITKQKRKWDIVCKAIVSLDAVSVRLMKDKAVVATRTLRTVDAPDVDAETAATPATAGGYDVTAVVQCVAREVREAISESTKQLREMVGDVVRSQSQMLKDMAERHSAAEKALLDARETLMTEREERIAEREDLAANAEAKAEAEAERTEKAQEQALVMKVIELAGPKIMEKIASSMNGAAPAKAIAPSPSPPVVKPDA